MRRLRTRARPAGCRTFWQPPGKPCALTLTALLALVAPAITAQAQTAYRYRDGNGQWVFTDQAGGAAAPGSDAITLAREHESLHLTIGRDDTPEATRLIARNNCVCVVTLRVTIVRSDFTDMPVGATYRATMEPGAQQTLACR